MKDHFFFPLGNLVATRLFHAKLKKDDLMATRPFFFLVVAKGKKKKKKTWKPSGD